MKTASQKKRTKDNALPAASKAANQKAIRLIVAWAKEPQEYDAKFWQDFDREIQSQRFQLRRHM